MPGSEVTVQKHHACVPHDQMATLANQFQATARQLQINWQAASRKLLRSQEQTGPDVLLLAANEPLPHHVWQPAIPVLCCAVLKLTAVQLARA